jgi:hypothetical protein
MNDRALSRWSSDEPSPAEVVAALNGKPIWGPRRAVDMQIFDFGEGVPIVDRNGRDRMIGEYRLHIQSDWRFVRKGVAFVTYEDLWLPTTDASMRHSIRTWVRGHCEMSFSNGSFPTLPVENVRSSRQP